MAIGTAAAIGLGVGAIGSAIGASSSSKAAGKAADASLAVAKENNALAKDIYNQNTALLSPYNQRGNVAGDYINAFLGIPGTSTTTTTPGTTTTTPGTTTTVSGKLDATKINQLKAQYGNNWLMQYYQNGSSLPVTSAGATTTTPATTTTTPNVTQAQAQNAFSSYLNNSDYAYQSALGGQQVSGNYSGLGTLQSGAALKALQDRQNNINQGYQGNWLSALANQQGVGLSGASAVAGVGQNYVNNVTASNTAAGNAAANAAIIKGQNNPFASGLGFLSGTILG